MEVINKIKTVDGKLFNSDEVELAKKYEDSYSRIQTSIDKLGKEPTTCIRITQESLDNAIKVFKEECELWFPTATEQFFEVERDFHFHEGIIGRYLSDSDNIPRNLYYLCSILCSINIDLLLRYDQIWSKNNPIGIEIQGE